MIGLRFKVGGDWLQYDQMLDAIQNKPLARALTMTEPGYAFLNWLAGRFGADIWFVNTACAIIFTTGLVSLCRWQSNPPLAMLVAVPYLVIVVAMGYTRQAAALGFTMFAMTQLHRGNFYKMIALLLAATLFHKSAIVVLPFFGLGASRQRFFGLLIVVGVSAALYSYVISSSLDFYVRGYLDTGYSSSGAMVRLLMNVVPAVLFILFRKRFRFEPAEERLWTFYSLGAFASLSLLTFLSSSTAVDRLALYLIPLQVVVFSRLPIVFSDDDKQTMAGVTAVVVYSAAVELVWLNFGQFASLWVPYNSYLAIWLT